MSDKTFETSSSHWRGLLAVGIIVAGYAWLISLLHGGPELVSELIGRGFYISFAGVVTFGNAEQCRAAAKKVPFERLLPWPNAPRLAPGGLRFVPLNS